jgi:triosephosphate isomerase
MRVKTALKILLRLSRGNIAVKLSLEIIKEREVRNIMRDIFVNLKRFDVPRRLGGVCPVDDPIQWIEFVIDECVRLGLGRLPEARVTLFLPEALLANAICQLRSYASDKTAALAIGFQGVFWEDVAPGGNFGAFTTNRPAASMQNLGCDWALIGHSEERRDKLEMIAQYDPMVLAAAKPGNRANQALALKDV